MCFSSCRRELVGKSSVVSALSRCRFCRQAGRGSCWGGKRTVTSSAVGSSCREIKSYQQGFIGTERSFQEELNKNLLSRLLRERIRPPLVFLFKDARPHEAEHSAVSRVIKAAAMSLHGRGCGAWAVQAAALLRASPGVSVLPGGSWAPGFPAPLSRAGAGSAGSVPPCPLLRACPGSARRC